MRINVTNEQYKLIIETARIQPWKGYDENGNKIHYAYKDGKKVQVKRKKGEKAQRQYDVPDDAIGMVLDRDREMNKAFGLRGDDKVNSLERFQQASGEGKKAIDALQDNLTGRVKQRYMDTTGRDKAVVPPNEIGNVGNKKLKDKFGIDKMSENYAEALAKYGMEVEIKGKTFSYGNSKVPENTLIINLTSAFNCPSKNGDCQWGKRCYAHDTETQYDKTEYRNLRNQHFLKMLTPREILQLVEAYIENAPLKIKYIRLHEDGDFADQETVEFCDKLAGHLKAKYGIQTTAYTHRVLDYSNINNIIVNGSSYKIKSCDRYFIPVAYEDWKKIPEGLDLSGKDIPMVSTETGLKVDTTHGTYKCPCDCRKCYFCYRTKQQNGEPENNAITIIETAR